MTVQPTIEDIAADVAQLKRENAELRSRIETLHPGASPRGWRRSLPALLTSAIVVTGLLALTGSRATAGAGSGPSEVVAPFNVVDAAGDPVMTVGSNGTTSFYNNKKNFAVLVAGAGGGELQVRAFQGNQATLLGQDTIGGFLQLDNNLKASTAGGVVLETNATGGLLQLKDPFGRKRAALGFTPEGNVQFSILNPAGNTVANLDETTKGGHLVLANQGGISRVEAGVVGGDVGEVNAYGPGGTRFLQGN